MATEQLGAKDYTSCRTFSDRDIKPIVRCNDSSFSLSLSKFGYEDSGTYYCYRHRPTLGFTFRSGSGFKYNITVVGDVGEYNDIISFSSFLFQ